MSQAADGLIRSICLNAARMAADLRRRILRARTGPHEPQRGIAVARLRRAGANWINRTSNQVLPILDRFDPNQLDQLVGCLARVEHAIRFETAPMRRLKAAVRHRLQLKLEQELTPKSWVRIRYIGRPGQEFEWEAFDPSPPPPGTTLLTHFAFGKATLSARHLAIIGRIAAAAVARMPSAFALFCVLITVEGHEDEVGDPARFRRLGLERAIRVAQALGARLTPRIAALPAASRRRVAIVVSSAGPGRPIRSNVTAEGRALNRRVEVRTSVGPCPGETVT